MAEKHVVARAGAINPTQTLSPYLLAHELARCMRGAVMAERALAAMTAMDANIDTAISATEAAWGDANLMAASILGEAEHLPDVIVLIAAIVERMVALRDEEEGKTFMQQIHNRRADLWLAACCTGDLRLQRGLAWTLDALQDMAALDTFGAITPPQGSCPAAPDLSQHMDLTAA
ncbi:MULTISPECIES: hypothetical protein [unclassified Yoonia]|uniref:hypothetical protein n=1 Tax=unclassified Yoonia TaxID=2629118 RepID=UPI002AFF1AE6|nr:MULTISPECIES: hypothetical protein [unclassified Yoonia]